MPKKKDIIIFTTGCTIILAAIVIVLLNVIPFKTKLDKNMDGIKFNVNAPSDTEEGVALSISGTYFNYIINWWNSDKFEGKIVLSDVPETEDWTTPKLPIMAPNDYVYGNKAISMIYYIPELNILDAFGEMAFEGDFSKCVIMSNEGSGKTREIFYAFPAKDVNEAVNLANELTDNIFKIELK